MLIRPQDLANARGVDVELPLSIRDTHRLHQLRASYGVCVALCESHCVPCLGAYARADEAAYHAGSLLLIVLKSQGKFDVVATLDLKLNGENARVRYDERKSEFTASLDAYGVTRPRKGFLQIQLHVLFLTLALFRTHLYGVERSAVSQMPIYSELGSAEYW